MAAFQQAGRFTEMTGKSSTKLLVGACRGAASGAFRRLGYRGRSAARMAALADSAIHLSDEARHLLAMEPAAEYVQTVGDTLRAELRRSPLPQYLRTEDRNSMAHSVEARVPFLDHRLVEAALRLPKEQQLWDGWNKVALRQIARKRVPRIVTERRVKFGFPTSAQAWFAGELSGRLKELVLDDLTYRGGLLSRQGVETLLRQHISGQADHSSILFGIAQAAAFAALEQQPLG